MQFGLAEMSAGPWGFFGFGDSTGDSVAKLVSSSSFGHGFLRNVSISRKLLVVFAVLMVSLAAVGLISMTGMRIIFTTFDRATEAYSASKLAAQIESSVSRVIAAQNQYLRMGGDAQAHAVIIGIDEMRKSVASLTELTQGSPVAENVTKLAGIMDQYAKTFESLRQARENHKVVAEEATKKAETLSAAFAALAA